MLTPSHQHRAWAMCMARQSLESEAHCIASWSQYALRCNACACCRKTLADYLKDLRSVDGGDRQLTSWLKEEGFNTNLRSVREVMQPFGRTIYFIPLSCHQAGTFCACIVYKQGTFSTEGDGSADYIL